MYVDIPNGDRQDLASRLERLHLKADGPEEAEFLCVLMWAITGGGKVTVEPRRAEPGTRAEIDFPDSLAS